MGDGWRRRWRITTRHRLLTAGDARPRVRRSGHRSPSVARSLSLRCCSPPAPAFPQRAPRKRTAAPVARITTDAWPRREVLDLAMRAYRCGAAPGLLPPAAADRDRLQPAVDRAAPVGDRRAPQARAASRAGRARPEQRRHLRRRVLQPRSARASRASACSAPTSVYVGRHGYSLRLVGPRARLQRPRPRARHRHARRPLRQLRARRRPGAPRPQLGLPGAARGRQRAGHRPHRRRLGALRLLPGPRLAARTRASCTAADSTRSADPERRRTTRPAPTPAARAYEQLAMQRPRSSRHATIRVARM